MNKGGCMKEFCSAAEISEKWGLSRRRVQVLCAQSRIQGAMKIGTVWVIPTNAQKPKDPRIENK